MAHKKTFEELTAGKSDIMLHVHGITGDTRVPLFVYLASKLHAGSTLTLFKMPMESAFRIFYSIGRKQPETIQISAADISAPQIVVAESPRIRDKIAVTVETARESGDSHAIEARFKESPILIAHYIIELMDFSGDFPQINMFIEKKYCVLNVTYNSPPKSCAK